HFEGYVWEHLKQRSVDGTVQRRRIFVCRSCGAHLDDQHVRLRRERAPILGRDADWMTCPVCDKKTSIVDTEEHISETSIKRIAEIDQAADAQRRRDRAALILQGKIATEDFDVFLCHSGKRQETKQVEQIGKQLKEQGILPWLDVWNLLPGVSFVDTL